MSKARIAGVFYLLTFIFGIYALVIRGTYAVTAGLIASGCYLVVTLIFYLLFAPVNRSLSFVAAIVSLAGLAVGVVQARVPVNAMVFFGFYCLLIGYLVFKSTFLPRSIGVLMAMAGVAWLTFLSPRFAQSLSPYLMIPGFIGEGSLTLWLLFGPVGVPTGAPPVRV